MNASLIEILFYVCCVMSTWFTLFLIGVFEYRKGDTIPFINLMAAGILSLTPIFNVGILFLSVICLWLLNDFDEKLTSFIKKVFK